MVEDEGGNEKKEPTGRRLMAVGKSNYAPDGADQTMSYQVETRPVTMKDETVVEPEMIVFSGTAPYTADEIAAGIAGVAGKTIGKPSKSKEAEKFLRRVLKPGQIFARVVMEAAKNAGIAEVTLRRAKEKLRDEGRLFVEKQPGGA